MDIRQAELVIVGGGASGTAMLQALAAGAPRLRAGGLRRVVLFERAALLGPGLPYGEAADPLHTMGRTRTLRRDKGLVLRRRFADALAVLAGSGVEVDLCTGAQVDAIAPVSGGLRVASGEAGIEAPRVVLATGHWHVPRLAGLERAVDWRWDVRRLHAGIADDEDVIVLGMQQSGLDVALSLAARRRGLPRAGRIKLVSRLGLLPGVFGHVGGRQVATRALEALLPASRVGLEEILAAVHAGAEAVRGSSLPRVSPESLRAAAERAEGTSLLRRELAQARASLSRGRPIPWHPVLWHGLAGFHALLPRLSAEDRLRLAAHWTPVMRHLEAIHHSAAEQVLALIDAGVVELHGLGAEIRLEEDARGVRAVGPRGEVHGARIVDARGPDPRLDLADPPGPLQALLAAGSVASGRVAFDATPAAIPRDLPMGWSVTREGRADWLVTGGLWVDPDTFAALDARGRSAGLSALGPLTVGQFPFYAGLWATRAAAGRIVASLD